MKKFLTKRPYLMFLLPGIIVYSVFVVYPILSAGYISFFQVEWLRAQGICGPAKLQGTVYQCEHDESAWKRPEKLPDHLFTVSHDYDAHTDHHGLYHSC